MTIRPVEAYSFHADGRTDRHDEANSRFSQFCKRAYKLDKQHFSFEFFLDPSVLQYYASPSIAWHHMWSRVWISQRHSGVYLTMLPVAEVATIIHKTCLIASLSHCPTQCVANYGAGSLSIDIVSTRCN